MAMQNIKREFSVTSFTACNQMQLAVCPMLSTTLLPNFTSWMYVGVVAYCLIALKYPDIQSKPAVQVPLARMQQLPDGHLQLCLEINSFYIELVSGFSKLIKLIYGTRLRMSLNNLRN